MEAHLEFLVDCIPNTPDAPIPSNIAVCANFLCKNVFFTKREYHILMKKKGTWMVEKLGKFPVLLLVYGQKLFCSWEYHL